MSSENSQQFEAVDNPISNPLSKVLNAYPQKASVSQVEVSPFPTMGVYDAIGKMAFKDARTMAFEARRLSARLREIANYIMGDDE